MRRLCIPIITGVLLAASVAGVTAQEDSKARPAIPSAGCGGTDVEPGIQRALTINVDDVERGWSMYVPEGYDTRTPVPMWIGLHGRGLSPASQIAHASGLADEQGFVVVAPQRDHFGGDHWMWDGDDTEMDVSRSNPDIALIDALIDRVEEDLCIDLARVYATGFSSGGGGVTVLACVLEDRIAAASAVVGLTFDLGDACELARPVPFLAIHGTADSGPYFAGGFRIGHRIKELYGSDSIPDRVGAIAGRNGCEAEPTGEAMSESVERVTWACPAGAEVELVVIEGGGHRWPTSFLPNPVDATAEVWEFFEQHPMPE